MSAETSAPEPPGSPSALDTGLWPRRRTPAVLQQHASECGLACLAMVLAAHGAATSLQDLRRAVAVRPQGLSLWEMQELAHAQGLLPTAYEAAPGELEDLRLPAILFWKPAHYVVLVSVTAGRSAEIHDPAVGARSLSWGEFEEGYGGFLLELTPSDGFRAARSAQSKPGATARWGLLRRLADPAGMVRTVSLAVLFELTLLSGPFFLQALVDQVVGLRDVTLLATLGVGIVCVVLLRVAARLARDWSAMALAAVAGVTLKSAVMSQVMRMPLGWHSRHGIAQLQARLAGVEHVRDLLNSGHLMALLDVALAAVSLLALIGYSPALAAVTAVACALSAGAAALLQPHLARASNAYLVASQREHLEVADILRGVDVLKLHNREAQELRRHHIAVMSTENKSLDLRRVHMLYGNAAFAIQALEEGVVLTLAAYMVLTGGLTLGQVFAFIAFRQLMVGKVAAVASVLTQHRMLRLHLDSASDLFEETPEPSEGQDSATPDTVALHVKALRYAYPGAAKLSLAETSFEVPAGTSVAVLGGSGAGKTTLVELLLGKLPCPPGAVFANGVDMTQMSPRQRRQFTAAVLQRDHIFAATVEDNVTLFDPAPDDELVERVLRQVGLGGRDTEDALEPQLRLSDDGSELSQEQRVRLLVARAVYRGSSLVILDDVLTALAPQAQAECLAALKQSGATIVLTTTSAALAEQATSTVRL